MRTVEFAYAAGLLEELLFMGFERNAVFAQTDTDLARRSIAATDALHEKFLDGHLLVEGGVGDQISVAKTTRSQISLDAILTVKEQGALRQTVFGLHFVHILVQISLLTTGVSYL